jgi:ABC-type iron transport system FetAB permease component
MKLFPHSSRVDNNLFIITILVIAAVFLQVMDKSFGNTFSLSLGDIFPQADILVFGLMVLISITVQTFLIKKTNISLKLRSSKPKLGRVVGIITISLQYFADGLIVIILFQTIFISQYNVNLLEAIVGINLLTSSILLAILSSRFLHTFRNSQSKVVLAYTIAIAVLH